jgi:transcriptional regulator with PAS, ATPase and Fis domain
MKINSRENKAFLDKLTLGFFITDKSRRYTWVSKNFTNTTGFDMGDLKGKPFDSILTFRYKDETGDRLHYRIVPNPARIQLVIASFIYYDVAKEGYNVNVQCIEEDESYVLYSFSPILLSAEKKQLRYDRELFAILDRDHKLEEMNNVLYTKLRGLFGNRYFRGTSLFDLLDRDTFANYRASKWSYMKYALSYFDDTEKGWKTLFNTKKNSCTDLFEPVRGIWKITDSRIIKERESDLDKNFLLSSQPFAFFENEYWIDYEVENNIGGITFWATNNPETTPDEFGYLVFFDKNRVLVKRNANTVRIEPVQSPVRQISIIKSGGTFSVRINGKELIRHMDSIPFFEKSESLNRFGFYCPGRETYKRIRIRSKKSSFDYDKLREYNRPVRFRNDQDRLYELRINMGEYLGSLKRFLFMRELSDLSKTEQRVMTLKSELDKALVKIESQHGFHGLVSTSTEMGNIIRTIKVVAKTSASVLVTGETGTGKDIVASAIHLESQREGPFVKVDCASLPYSLIESELFGHEKGAFTGANTQKKGKFELANKGTLFLDEIGNISPEVQMKLLRFLQDRRFERLGGRETLQSDVRIIAATNTNLEKAVDKGKFRSDLFYRINVMHIEVPRLRDRLIDIYPIVNFLITELARKNNLPVPHIDNQVFPFLLQYHWPGNVRELRNVVEQTMILNRGRTLTVDIFPDYIKEAMRQSTLSNAKLFGGKQVLPQSPAERRSYRDRETFLKAYDKFNHSPHRMAAYFDCSYFTISRYMKLYGIVRSRQAEALNYLDKFKEMDFPIKDFREFLHITLPTARKYLDELCRQGKLKRIQRGRRVRFQVVDY